MTPSSPIATSNCPYCGNTLNQISEDHIFSDFLGGIRTISTCDPCNNGFGNSFEGRASTELLKLRGVLALMGVNRPWKSRFRWKYAHIKAGVPHDFVFDDEEILCVRSRPEVVRNETNQVTQVLVRSESEAKDQMKALQRKHPKMEFDFTMTKSSVLLEDVQIRMKAGIDLGLLALKMSVAHATLLDDFNLDQVKTAVHYLNFRRW